MRGELEIGTWKNPHGVDCCIHVDRAATEKDHRVDCWTGRDGRGRGRGCACS